MTAMIKLLMLFGAASAADKINGSRDSFTPKSIEDYIKLTANVSSNFFERSQVGLQNTSTAADKINCPPTSVLGFGFSFFV